MKYTDEMNEFIRANYMGISSQELADLFTEHFGIQVSAGQMKSYRANRGLNCGLTGRFEKGIIPFNKGMKVAKETYDKCYPTMFKKGNIPTGYRPVGSERISVDGYIEIKVQDPRKWMQKHKYVWESQNGKIPKGHVIIFLDKNRLNTDISNLKMISRSELLIMNRHDLFNKNAELTETATNLAKLIDTSHQVKKKKKSSSQ